MKDLKKSLHIIFHIILIINKIMMYYSLGIITIRFPITTLIIYFHIPTETSHRTSLALINSTTELNDTYFQFISFKTASSSSAILYRRPFWRGLRMTSAGHRWMRLFTVERWRWEGLMWKRCDLFLSINDLEKRERV